MPNKYYSDVNSDYLVEGAGKNGYMKNSGKGYGDGKTSNPVTDYSEVGEGSYGAWGKDQNWFEGKKGNVGSGMRGPQGKL